MIGEKVLPAIDRNKGNLPRHIDNTLRKLDLSELAQGMKIPTATDSKNIAKQLASFGNLRCSASEGGACDNPMNYLEDIKKQQALAKGSGERCCKRSKKN